MIIQQITKELLVVVGEMAVIPLIVADIVL
jgi:hypothetical protein